MPQNMPIDRKIAHDRMIKLPCQSYVDSRGPPHSHDWQVILSYDFICAVVEEGLERPPLCVFLIVAYRHFIRSPFSSFTSDRTVSSFPSNGKQLI